MAMHGFSRHSGAGGGGGGGPVNYFLSDHYHVEGKGWLLRNPLPQVVEGDPELMIQMINALDYKHKYTSGVLSFTHNDTEKLKLRGLNEAITYITSRLKEMLFAGIASEHHHILIVSQSHLDRLELHYVLPRHNYEVDRAWNPAPPGDAKYLQMDALVDLINVKYGLDDPRDPIRARLTKAPQWEPSNSKTTRELLDAFFKEAVVDGLIDSRRELIDFAKKSGLIITREGKNYISMKAPESDKAIKLKGEIYNEQFTNKAKLRNSKAKSAERETFLAKPAVVERYKKAIRERQSFIEKRFEKKLRIVRAEKSYSETNKFNSTKRGDILEGHNDSANHFAAKHSNEHTTNNEVINDSFGSSIDSVIARAKRIIHHTEQSYDRASRVVEAGSVVVKSTPERVRGAIIVTDAVYAVVPSAPASIAGMVISNLGATGRLDLGDPEADRIIKTKRSESVTVEQAKAVQSKSDAIKNNEKLKGNEASWLINSHMKM